MLPFIRSGKTCLDPEQAVSDIGRFHIVNRPAKVGEMEISYYTYMKYKGCESRVVILLDVDDTDERWANKNGIYTAMSRAVHQLFILHK